MRVGKDEAYFRAIPWCRAYLDNPAYSYSTQGISRDWSPETHAAGNQHSFMSRTLNTPDTIGASYTLYKVPPDGDSVTETITFMALGSGLNGHIDIAHGGTVATILDEVAGLMLYVGRRPGGNPLSHIFTAYLNVRYLKPVRTPQVVVAKAKITLVEGRKEKVLLQLFDRYEEALAEGEALFIRVKSEEKL